MPRRRRSDSPPGGWRPSRWAWCSRPGFRASDVAGLPELVVGGLPDDDARELLASVLTGPLDAQVRDQIIADTNGNPLALLELPRGPDAGAAGGRVRAQQRGTA